VRGGESGVRRVDPGADFDVQLTLELARVAREPSLVDKQRVLEALQVRLGDMPSLPSAGESTTGVRLVVPKLGSPSAVARVARFARSLVTSKAALHLVWVGATTGALGFWLGARVTDTRAALDEARRGGSVAPSSVSVPMAEVPLAEVPLAEVPLAEVPPVLAAPAPAVAVHAPIPAPATEPASAVPARPPQVASARRTPNQSSAARGSEAAVVSAPPAVDPNAGFLEAVRLLSRAQRALDGGEPALALVLLEELDERVPRELLREERDAALIVALCKSGETKRARAAAAELAARSPSSIYAARIVRSCGSFDDAARAPR
jgi:hypothetical protein